MFHPAPTRLPSASWEGEGLRGAGVSPVPPGSSRVLWLQMPLVSSQGCGLLGVSETWWHESRSPSAGMEGCRLLRSLGEAGEVEVLH